MLDNEPGVAPDEDPEERPEPRPYEEPADARPPREDTPMRRFLARLEWGFGTATWKNFLLPCLAIGGALLLLKTVDYNDKAANVGTAARVDIMRKNYEGLRDLSEGLRLWQSDLDGFVVSRADRIRQTARHGGLRSAA